MKPTVSVVVPARNAEHNLPALLAGLRRQRLVGGEFETIVVDNGSADRTAEIASAGGAQVVHEARPGQAAARNAGIRAGLGEVVVFLDSDCIPRDGWLERLVAALADAPLVGGVGGRVVAAPPRNLLERYAARQGYLSQEEALAHPYLPWVLTANCAYRRPALLSLGGFNESFRSGEDVDLSWRMQLRLGLGIAFASDAVVEHVHRGTLLGLWKQWVTYGWGRANLARRYPWLSHHRRRPPPHEVVLWTAARLARSASAMGQLAFGRGDRMDVVAPVLEVMEQVAHRVGRVQRRRASWGADVASLAGDPELDRIRAGA